MKIMKYEKIIIDFVKIHSKFNLGDMLTQRLRKTKFLKNRLGLRIIYKSA